MKIKIEVSARHIHLTQADVDVLFGKNYQLTPEKFLSQPGMFAAKEIVKIIGPKSAFEKVRIVGPARGYTQFELSLTDAFKFGVVSPIRYSGDIKGTPGMIVVGPNGQVEKKEGVVIALRHLHTDTAGAKKLKVKNGKFISVQIKGERETIFKKVFVRVSDDFATAVHLDTDEGNAAGVSGATLGEII